MSQERQHTALLSVRGLSVSYGDIRAVDDVSVEVGQGQAVAVIGANGAGKTSFARAVMGLIPARSGEVWLAGKNISRLRPERRAQDGLTLVPEGRGVLGGLTIEDNLLVGAYTRKREAKDLLAQVYESFPVLYDLRARHARVLSGGELQLVAIGRALMMKPKVLVLDEPSMGLSPKATGNLRAGLIAARDSGVSLLLIEQNITLAFDLCEDVYVLSLGHVALQGEASTVVSEAEIKQAYLGA
jgi:branched-chain amino acid transport system ATP-binding protein